MLRSVRVADNSETDGSDPQHKKRRRVYRGNIRLPIAIKYKIVEKVGEDSWIYIVYVILWSVIDKSSNGTANIVLLSCHVQQLSSRKCSKQSV